MLSSVSLRPAGAARSSELDGVTSAGYYAIRINGTPSANHTYVVRLAGGETFVPLDFATQSPALADSRCDATYLGRPVCSLAAIRGARVWFDATLRRYDIVVPDKAAVVAERGKGAFVNYDVRGLWGGASSDSRPHTLSSIVEAGTTAGSGVLTTNLFGQTGDPSRPRFSLLGTTWQRDDVNAHATLRIGDAVTFGGAFGAEFRFTGVQWSSNFDTDPDFVTRPSLMLGGISSLPSVVDLYVNNALTSSKNVPAGPFEVRNTPTVDGQGQVRLVVRDLLGRQQVIAGSYYGTPSLLKRGLRDFAYEAGVERSNYGSRSFQYGSAFIEGNERRGITNRFTGEAHAEIAARVQESGVVGNWLVPALGVFDAGVSASRGALGSGAAALLGYDYRKRGLNVGASVQAASPGFTLLGAGGSDVAASRQTSVHLGLENERGDSLGMAYAEQTYFGSDGHKLLTVSLHRELRHGDLEIDGLRRIGPSGGLGFEVYYHASLGRRRSLSIESDRESGYRYDRIELERGRPAGGYGIGSRLLLESGDSNALSAQLSSYAPTGKTVLSVRAASNGLQFESDLAGGIAFVGHERFFIPKLSDAFGVAHVGYANVRVYSDDRLVGMTNARGDIAIANLSAYNSTNVRIEKADLPRGVVARGDTLTLVPGYRAPTSFAFATEREPQTPPTPLPAHAAGVATAKSGYPRCHSRNDAGETPRATADLGRCFRAHDPTRDLRARKRRPGRERDGFHAHQEIVGR